MVHGGPLTPDPTGKWPYVGEVRVGNVLNLTDPATVRGMGIDPVWLTMPVSESHPAELIYAYTGRIANRAYDKGYSGILYPSSRNPYGGRALVLFEGRYDPAYEIIRMLDFMLERRE